MEKTINSFGFNFLEPVVVETVDDEGKEKILISEEDLKKIINQAYEAGRNSAYTYEPIQFPPSSPTPINPPTYPYYPVWYCTSNQSYSGGINNGKN